MYVEVNKSYRFLRNADQQEQMLKLIRDLKIFKDYASVMMASAIIGYRNDLYKEIENRASDGVQIQFFNNVDLEIIDLIAYAHKKEQGILNKEEKYHIFESYANGGFPLLYKKLNVNDETTIDKREELLTTYFTLIKDSKGFNI